MKHFYRDVPGWAAFARLYVDMVARSPSGSHFVEIGSWLGRSAALMAVEIANSGKAIRFDCIDPWSDGGPDLRHKVEAMSVPIYDQFLANIAPVAAYINPIRLPSLEAAKLYGEVSLDFVMIDGSHQYEDVCADIHAWGPKIKPGGVLAGDDWNWPGVARAVQDNFEPHEYTVIDSGKKIKSGTRTTKYWVVQC